MKTIEVDLDTLERLKDLKLRPDESLNSVVGRLAVYCYDWEPLTEEFIKRLEELEQKKDNFVSIEKLMDNLCDENIEETKEKIPAYKWYHPEFIEEIDDLMAQKPIDLPAGMSLSEADDKLVIELNESSVELLEGITSPDESLDSTIKRIADYGIDGEEIMSYGSIREIQRLLREGKSVGPFKTVKEFNEHLKYLHKEKILV